MKIKSLLIFFISFVIRVSAQTYDWTWMKGDSIPDVPGVYGTPLVPDPTNNPGGRHMGASWTDSSGNFWLLGGGYNPVTWELYNDLWKYNEGTNEWTWMKGDSIDGVSGVYGTVLISAPTNKPGGRWSATTWADNSGNLWLFGGQGHDAGSGLDHLNDLWKYNIATNEWTWMKGDNTINMNGTYGTLLVSASANKPGGRQGPVSWTDASGKLWLFGGYGYASAGQGFLNDLWNYDPSTNEWTWVKGDNNPDINGVYGTQLTSSSSNKPGGRYGSVTWIDNAGNLWLYGGYGYAASGSVGYLNDLWKYDLSTNEWTWVKGDNTTNNAGIYGTILTPAATNQPGGRNYAVSWKDNAGNLLLFGGYGRDENWSAGWLCDVWKYNINTNEWAWIKGATTILINGEYGTIQVSSATNMPGGRQGATGWKGASDCVWLLGGYGYPGDGATGWLNDLWRLCYTTLQLSATITSTNVLCNGDSTGTATVIATGGTSPYSYAWSNGQTDSTAVGLPLGTYSCIVKDSLNDSVIVNVTIAEPLVLSLSSQVMGTCMGQCTGTATINVSGGTAGYSYSWQPSWDTTSTADSLCAGSYTIIVTDTNACTDTIDITIITNSLPTINAGADDTICSGQSALFSATGSAGNYLWNTGATTQTIIANSAASYIVSVTDNNNCSSSDTVVLILIPAPILQFTGDTLLCAGESTTLTVTGADNYQWNTNSNDSAVTVTPATDTSYTVIGTNVNGCGDTLDIIVIVNSLPMVDAGEDDTICSGEQTQLNVTPMGSYQWIPSNGLNSITVASPIASPIATTIYTVTVTDNNGCVNIDTVTVVVHSVAAASFTPDPTDGQIPLSVVFTNASANSDSYEWSFGDDSISIDANPTHIYTEGGEYTVQLIANNSDNCPDTAIYTFINVDATSILWISNSFSPNGDGVNDNFGIYTFGIIKLEANIYNRWGELIYSWNTLNGSWDGSYKGIGVEEGVYVYVVKATGIDGVIYNRIGHVSVIR